jgi:hypothetical protein
MNYTSTESFESKVFPGVTVTLKKMSSRRRAEFNLSMAPLLAKARNLAIANEPIEQEYAEHVKASEIAKANGSTDLPVFPDAKLDQLGKAWTEQRRFEQDEMSPQILRWGVASIDGLTIDGKPATVESLIDAGPPELSEEITAEVTRVMRLSAAEIKNSGSPTTSGAVVDTATPSLTARTADSDTTTSSGTATATSPS